MTRPTTRTHDLTLHRATRDYLRNYTGPVAFEDEPAFDTMQGTAIRVVVHYDGKRDENFVAVFGITSGEPVQAQYVLWCMARYVAGQAAADPGFHPWQVALTFTEGVHLLDDYEHAREYVYIQTSTAWSSEPTDCTHRVQERSTRGYPHTTVTR